MLGEKRRSPDKTKISITMSHSNMKAGFNNVPPPSLREGQLIPHYKLVLRTSHLRLGPKVSYIHTRGFYLAHPTLD